MQRMTQANPEDDAVRFCSANEVAGLAQKAATGAGFPPSQAETFGRAVAVHLGAGRAALAVSTALDDPLDSPVLRLPLLMDDVLRAVALTGGEIALTLHPGDEALALAYARLLPMRLVTCQVTSCEGASSRLVIEGDPSVPAKPVLPPRIALPAELQTFLEGLAARTYVPATEASRTAGAGAGNIDND